jgi:hypothetical protein
MDELLAARYEKFRRMGVFLEGTSQGALAAAPLAGPHEPPRVDVVTGA